MVEVLFYDLGSLFKIKFDSFQKVAVGLFQSRCTFKNWVTFFDLGALKRSKGTNFDDYVYTFNDRYLFD